MFIQWFLDRDAVPDEIFETVKITIFNLVMPGKEIPLASDEPLPGHA